jgi:acyl carrier protein
VVEERVRKVFVSVLNLDPTPDRTALVYNQAEGWDSVAHMMLVAGLEEEFDCMLEMNEILDMSSYDKVVDIMAKHG